MKLPTFADEQWQKLLIRLRDSQLQEARMIPEHELAASRATLLRICIERLDTIPRDLSEVDLVVATSSTLTDLLRAFDNATIGTDDAERIAMRRYVRALVVGHDSGVFINALHVELRELGRGDLVKILSFSFG